MAGWRWCRQWRTWLAAIGYERWRSVKLVFAYFAGGEPPPRSVIRLVHELATDGFPVAAALNSLSWPPIRRRTRRALVKLSTPTENGPLAMGRGTT